MRFALGDGGYPPYLPRPRISAIIIRMFNGARLAAVGMPGLGPA